jgi:hypothetical protein
MTKEEFEKESKKKTKLAKGAKKIICILYVVFSWLLK